MVHQEYIFTEASGTEHIAPVFLSGEWALVDQLDTLTTQHHAISARPRSEPIYEPHEGHNHTHTGLVFPPTSPRPGPESCERLECGTDLPHFAPERASGRGYISQELMER